MSTLIWIQYFYSKVLIRDLNVRGISPYYVAVGISLVLGFSVIYVLPTFGLFSLAEEHSLHNTKVAEASLLPLFVDDYDTSYEMFNDGRVGLLTIYEDIVDPENHCEFCLRIDYTPGAEGRAGLALAASEPLNLEGAQRLVVFARAQIGGDKVQLFAAGEKTDITLGDLSTSAKWAAVSEEITLKNSYRKYELDVSQGKLDNLTYLFGIELPKNDERTKVVLYIQGITIDDVGAERPTPLKAIDAEITMQE
jgi:hypothetical protein